ERERIRPEQCSLIASTHLQPPACGEWISFPCDSSHGVPVFLVMGGEATPVSADLLSQLTFLTANETELARIAKLPTDTDEQVVAAAKSVQKSYSVPKELVTLGERGAILFLQDGTTVQVPGVKVENVVDITGA